MDGRIGGEYVVVSDVVRLFGLGVVILLLVSESFNSSLIKPVASALLTTLDWGGFWTHLDKVGKVR